MNPYGVRLLRGTCSWPVSYTHLIENAIRYNRPHGQVRVEITTEEAASDADASTLSLIHIFRKEGWRESHGKGSHLVFRKNGLMITVPTSRKELPLGTYRSIARVAGWL